MSYVKPDGKVAKSGRAYVKAWRELWRPLEKAYGFAVISFDPDIWAKEGWSGREFCIPLPVAKRMVDVAWDAKYGPAESEGE